MAQFVTWVIVNHRVLGLKYSGRRSLGQWVPCGFLCEYSSPGIPEDVCPWGNQRRWQPQGVSLGQLCLVTVKYTLWKKKHTLLFPTNSSWHKPTHKLCHNHYCSMICIRVQSIFSWYMTNLATGDMYFTFLNVNLWGENTVCWFLGCWFSPSTTQLLCVHFFWGDSQSLKLHWLLFALPLATIIAFILSANNF